MKLPFFLVRRFVAAETLEGTLPVARQISAQGLKTTLDLLGEYISKRELAVQARDSYLGLVGELAAQDTVDRNISIKLSMLGQKIDEEFCLDNLHQLLSAARECGAFVRLDMEGSDVTSSTVSILEKVYPDYPENVGIVLQSYLHRTRDDVAQMCELGARVRLCKGAYKEPAAIAYQDVPTIRDRFLEYMETLLTKGNYPAIATHDEALISATMKYAQDNDVADDRYEFQMLYGLRSDRQREIATSGHNMRVYVPYGHRWFPYFSRRLRERKENVFFVLRHMFSRR